jgi:hypothetical protein
MSNKRYLTYQIQVTHDPDRDTVTLDAIINQHQGNRNYANELTSDQQEILSRLLLEATKK